MPEEAPARAPDVAGRTRESAVSEDCAQFQELSAASSAADAESPPPPAPAATAFDSADSRDAPESPSGDFEEDAEAPGAALPSLRSSIDLLDADLAEFGF
jgi:hypothetical protein